MYSNTDRMIDWIVGFTYSSDDIDTVIGQDFSMISFIQTTAFDGGLFTGESTYAQESDSIGIYASTETHLTDQLDLSIGLRYASDERKFVGVGTNTFGGFTFPTDSEDAVHDESDLSYRVGLEYQLMTTGSCMAMWPQVTRTVFFSQGHPCQQRHGHMLTRKRYLAMSSV